MSYCNYEVELYNFIYNCRGATEWKGDWSDTDKSRWSQRMRKALNYDPDKEDSDDGLFWMAFDDFVENYQNIYVCRQFKTVENGGPWYKYTAVSEWKGKTAGEINI